jgi:hypothetical protein
VRTGIEVASAITGMCLVNTNVPLAKHTHVCTREAWRAHEAHRCYCGSEWPAEPIRRTS